MTIAAVLMANGTEEMEAVITVDILRRAGISVLVTAVSGTPVKCSRSVIIVPDILIGELDISTIDALILPGGGQGTEAMKASPAVLDLVRKTHESGKLVCAVCAAPLVLHASGILRDKRFTCYPGVDRSISDGNYTAKPVEKDGNIITGRGPGTSFLFALQIVETLAGVQAADTVRKGLVSD